MQFLWLFLVLGQSAQIAANSQAAHGTAGMGANVAARAVRPPVLRSPEPVDNVIVLLPGPAPVAPPAIKLAIPPAPVTDGSATPEALDAMLETTVSGPRPFLRRTDRVYPLEFQENTPSYLQQHIGQWKVADAKELLGVALRQRPAFDDDQKENGAIFAFADPANQFKEFELDFDNETGLMRSVFAYPRNMTWQDCRRVYGADVAATDASKGRKFYSYSNRRLDVLVDASGKVVSLGLY